MTAKIFVGFRTRPVEDFKEFMPKFSASRVLTDPKKIEADIQAKAEMFVSTCKDAPYTGTFDEVFLVDRRKKKVLQWLYPPKDSDKPRICVSVRNYLLKAYPTAWDWDTHGKRPEVVFLGFNPRLFLKMLGLECSLPGVGKPLPPKLWYSNSDHRDIEEAVLPKDFEKVLTLDTVIKRRRPLDPEAAKKWDEHVKDWPGPGQVPRKDVEIAIELAAQLGFLSE